MANTESTLTEFGALLMERVRDPAIHDAVAVVSGASNSVIGVKVRAILAELAPAQIEAVLRVVPIIVDTTLHHLLWTVEQEQSIRVALDRSPDPVQEIRDSTLGELQGYLEPWIMQFSKQPYEPPV